MIVVFNVSALVIGFLSGLPCFLIFGLALSHGIGRPDLVEFNFHLSTLISIATLDCVLRFLYRGNRLRGYLDPRCGAHLFFVPLWCWGFLGAYVLL
jgi:hypothetical protein